MSKIVSDKLRARMDAEERRLALQAKEDKEYAVPGWVRPPLKPMFLKRVVERKTSMGHKVVYRMEYDK